MTAVNWMIDELLKRHSSTLGKEYIEIFEQAKNMEQGEICLAFLEGQHHSEKLPSQYYIETYGSKGSDETKYYEQSRGINIDSFQSEAPKKQDYIVKVTDVTSSQTENKGLDWLVSHWKKLKSEGEKMNWEQIIQITELAKDVPSSQTEISDDEIEKAAEDWQEFRQGAGKQSFEQGCKWYREQLKQRQ